MSTEQPAAETQPHLQGHGGGLSWAAENPEDPTSVAVNMGLGEVLGFGVVGLETEWGHLGDPTNPGCDSEAGPGAGHQAAAGETGPLGEKPSCPIVSPGRLSSESLQQPQWPAGDT